MDNTTLVALNLRNNSIGYNGGKVLTDMLLYNRTLCELVIADNHIGSDLAAVFTGRISGNISNVLQSVKAREIDMPLRYELKRYDRLSLAELTKRQKERKEKKLF